jgi:hypothetical protein
VGFIFLLGLESVSSSSANPVSAPLSSSDSSETLDGPSDSSSKSTSSSDSSLKSPSSTESSSSFEARFFPAAEDPPDAFPFGIGAGFATAGFFDASFVGPLITSFGGVFFCSAGNAFDLMSASKSISSSAGFFGGDEATSGCEDRGEDEATG